MTAISRGRFAAVPTWDELTARRPVYRDFKGEHVRLFTGGRVYRSNMALGHHCCVLNNRNGQVTIQLDNGNKAVVGAEVLLPLIWDVEMREWVLA